MSAKTRINRPTYSTPRKNPPGRFIHISTNYAWIGPHFIKVGKGITRK